MRRLALTLLLASACSPADEDADFSPWDDTVTFGDKADGVAPRMTLVGIGDSIMQGVHADEVSLLVDRPDNGFLLGIGLDSVSERASAKGWQVSPASYAVTGAAMAGPDGVVEQAEAVCATARQANRVIILLGGNDICYRAPTTPLYQLRSELRAGLDKLGRCLPRGARVVVLSVPRVDLLYQAQQELGTCDVSQSLGVCAPVVNTDAAGRARIGHLIDEYNQGIAAEVTAAARRHPRVGFRTDWEGNLADTSLGTHRFAADDISRLDCFHPARDTGQRKIACVAWEVLENGGRGKRACFAE